MNGKSAFIGVQTGTPTILWGRPGTGKTSWVKQLGELLNLPVEVVIASIREPSDFAGLPIITKDDNVRLAPPDWAKRLQEAGEGILFLDELSTAPPAVQSAALRVVQERAVGDIYLPDNIWVIAAANPTDTSSGTWTLSAALANRFLHIDWHVAPGAWVEGMLTDWSISSDIARLPDDWRGINEQMRSLIASFIQARPALLLDQPDNADQAGRAWPSPRTWEMVSLVLTAARSIGADDEVEIALLSGCIGNGPASEFLVWERNLDLPDPESLLAKPSLFKIPKRGDQTFAILSAVVTAAKGKLTKGRWNKAWEILAKAANGGHADIAAIPAKTLARARTDKLPVPDAIKAFLPILQAAGLLG